MANGQRGAKLHPGGRSIRLGGCPSMGISRSRRSYSLGTECSRPQAYGCLGSWKIRLIVVVSIGRPAYTTATVSDVSATDARLGGVIEHARPQSRDGLSTA